MLKVIKNYQLILSEYHHGTLISVIPIIPTRFPTLCSIPDEIDLFMVSFAYYSYCNFFIIFRSPKEKLAEL